MSNSERRIGGAVAVVGLAAALVSCSGGGQTLDAACKIVTENERALMVNAETTVLEAASAILGGDAEVSSVFVTTYDIIAKVQENVTNEEVAAELEHFNSTLQEAEDELQDLAPAEGSGGQLTIQQADKVQEALDDHTAAVQDAAEQMQEVCAVE